MTRIGLALLIGLILSLMVAGIALAQPPDTHPDQATVTPLPTFAWPTPRATPTPCYCDPAYSLTATVEVTHSAEYYLYLESIDTTFDVVSDTLASSIGNLQGLMGMAGLSAPGEEQPGSDVTGYSDYTLADMTSDIVVNLDETFQWFRAIGEISIMGTAVQFLSMSLAFILVVMLIKTSIKVLLMLINVLGEIIRTALSFIPFI